MPVLGYLDDLILIPLGIALVIKLVPDSVLAECRTRAQEVMQNGKPVSLIAGAVIVVIWLAGGALCRMDLRGLSSAMIRSAPEI